MAISAPPRLPGPALPDEPDALEALIEEARRRARRRRRLYAAAVVAAGVVVAAALSGLGQRGGGGAAEPVTPPEPPISIVPHAVTATNGELTILGGGGIASVARAGGLRTVVRCERMGPPRCAAHPFSLDWSPDGRRLAYATAIGPGAAATEWRNVGLHVLDTATGRHALRRLNCFANAIDWSPDGSRLAYACYGTIFFIPSDLSASPRALRTGKYASASSPSWSPDGLQIVFALREGRGAVPPAIYTTRVTAGGGATRVFVARGWAPAWSPDGTRIAYRARCGGIKFMTPAGDDVTPASVVLGCRAIGVSGFPVWSPDGRKLAVSRPSSYYRCPPSNVGACFPRQGVYVMDADGSQLRVVTAESGVNFDGTARASWRPRPARR
jgi:Tol biopolymer transport system component